MQTNRATKAPAIALFRSLAAYALPRRSRRFAGHHACHLLRGRAAHGPLPTMAAAKALVPATKTARAQWAAELLLRTDKDASDLQKAMYGITMRCGDDAARAQTMLREYLNSRDANQSGGAAAADRGAIVDAGRAARAPAAAPGKKRSASGDETADDAAPTTAKKRNPGPSAPVTPDVAAAASADPGAPKDASAPVVSPEASSGSQALCSGDAAPTAAAPPPLVAPLLAKPCAAEREAPAVVIEKKHPRQEDAQDVGTRYQNFIEETVPSLRMCQMKVMFGILKLLNRGAYKDALRGREGKDHESARKVLLALAVAVPPEAVLGAYADALKAHPAEKKLKPTA